MALARPTLMPVPGPWVATLHRVVTTIIMAVALSVGGCIPLILDRQVVRPLGGGHVRYFPDTVSDPEFESLNCGATFEIEPARFCVLHPQEEKEGARGAMELTFRFPAIAYAFTQPYRLAFSGITVDGRAIAVPPVTYEPHSEFKIMFPPMIP